MQYIYIMQYRIIAITFIKRYIKLLNAIYRNFLAKRSFFVIQTCVKSHVTILKSI